MIGGLADHGPISGRSQRRAREVRTQDLLNDHWHLSGLLTTSGQLHIAKLDFSTQRVLGAGRSESL